MSIALTVMPRVCVSFLFFFFNDTATTEIYTLSLHDALPIYDRRRGVPQGVGVGAVAQDRSEDHEVGDRAQAPGCEMPGAIRSEEHTSELQSRSDLVCRLLLEKKKSRACQRCRGSRTRSR